MVVSLPILLAALPVILVALKDYFLVESEDLVPVRSPAGGVLRARSRLWCARNELGHFFSAALQRKLGRSGFRRGGRLLLVGVLPIPLCNRIKNGFDLKGSQVGPRFQHQRDNARDVRTSKAVSG